MSNTDFSGARSALVGALSVAGPILTALQQADQVFGVLANAEKHKRVLEAEVADYKAELEKTKGAVTKLQEKLKAVTAEISVAEKEADARIEAALAAEKVQVQEAKVATAQAIATMTATRDKVQTEAATAMAASQAAHTEAMAAFNAKEASISVNITALEKKLEALRANAAKFAAALTAA